MIVQGKGDNYHVYLAHSSEWPRVASCHLYGVTLGGTPNSEPFVHLLLVQYFAIQVQESDAYEPTMQYAQVGSTNGRCAWNGTVP